MPQARRHRARGRQCRRRGAVLVEAALVLSVFLVLVIGMIELSFAVWHYNTVAEAARAGTREAIVHGQLAPPRRTMWGPAAYAGTAADSHEIAETVRGALAGIDPTRVSVEMTWPDGGNEISDRVSCTVTSHYSPTLTSLFTWGEMTLSATSTMSIVH